MSKNRADHRCVDRDRFRHRSEMIAAGYRVVGSVRKAAIPQVERLVGAAGLAAMVNNANVVASVLPVFR